MVVPELVRKHYGRPEVREVIAEYCRGRWVALEGNVDGRRVFIRYLSGKPLTIKSGIDVPSLITRYSHLNVRTFYATLNKYEDLSTTEALEDLSNILSTTPFWDIDTELSKWRYAVEAAELIIDFLEREGVSKSVYVIWSGEGIHVRLSEHAFSKELLSKHHPLDTAFAVVEYVLRSLKDKLDRLHKESGGVLKVENLVDIKRVFTVPLSLHRKLDKVAICLKPDDLTSFDPSWADVSNFRSRYAWREYVEGEADALASKALRNVGTSVKTAQLGIKSTRVGKREVRRREVISRGGAELGRFQVMALLQAARHYLLTGDLDKAKSFGLNRAIFYAWAKHYGRFYAGRRVSSLARKIRSVSTGEEVPEGSRKLVKVAGEEVFISPRGYCVMGGKEQLPEDYDRNVVDKIEAIIPYDVAWEAAIKYLSKFPKHVLTDPRKFFDKVYKPVRDSFIEKVVKEVIEPEVSERVPKEVPLRSVRLRPSTKAVLEAGKTKTLLNWVKKGNEGKEGKGTSDDQH